MYTFDTIIGHEQIKQHFKNAIILNKISHAYIINGEKGIGKKTLANTFAKTLECLEGREAPCLECDSCRLFESGNHPDIIYVTSNKAKSIGVEDVREQLNKDIYIKPYRFKYKIYIIEEADQLTDQAQNAILKTIEEPPSYAIILLLTNNLNKLLPTILSRCVVLNLKPIEDIKVINYLEKHYNMKEEAARIYTSFARGNIGRVKELIDSEAFNEMREHCIQLLSHLYDYSTTDLMKMTTEIENFKDQIIEYLDMMSCWFRDLLVIKAVKDKENLVYGEQYNLLLKQASVLPYNVIDRNIRLIESKKQQLFYNVNFQLVMETLLLKIKER